MPHISIKCYPKHLSEESLAKFYRELTQLVEKHLHAAERDISIRFTEVKEADWKSEVWDKEIAPYLQHLAKEPGYRL